MVPDSIATKTCDWEAHLQSWKKCQGAPHMRTGGHTAGSTPGKGTANPQCTGTKDALGSRAAMVA